MLELPQTHDVLLISNLHERHSGLTEPLAKSYEEAASVCLDRHHKEIPTMFDIEDRDNVRAVYVHWTATTQDIRRAWANEIDTTEAGAYGCVLAAVELTHGLVAFARAPTGSGADYYLARKDETPRDYDDCIRLEVSGVDRGPYSRVAHRLQEKLQQLRKGESALPGIAGVVGFEGRKILTASLEAPS